MLFYYSENGTNGRSSTRWIRRQACLHVLLSRTPRHPMDTSQRDYGCAEGDMARFRRWVCWLLLLVHIITPLYKNLFELNINANIIILLTQIIRSIVDLYISFFSFSDKLLFLILSSKFLNSSYLFLYVSILYCFCCILKMFISELISVSSYSTRLFFLETKDSLVY